MNTILRELRTARSLLSIDVGDVVIATLAGFYTNSGLDMGQHEETRSLRMSVVIKGDGVVGEWEFERYGAEPELKKHGVDDLGDVDMLVRLSPLIERWAKGKCDQFGVEYYGRRWSFRGGRSSLNVILKKYVDSGMGGRGVVKSEVISMGLKGKLNDVLTRLLTGQYFDKIPLRDIFDLMKRLGVVIVDEEGREWEGLLVGREGKAVFDLALVSSFREGKYEIDQRVAMTMTWYRMESGRYEVVAYVS